MNLTIAFIPVRCGSKGIPMKNIKSFCDRPLVYWTCKAAQESIHIDQVVIATDCDEIADVVNKFGFSKVKIYNRLSSNAQDTSSTESVMLEYLSKSPLADKTTFILIQATSPFTTSTHLDEAIELFGKEKFDSLLSVVENHNFFWGKEGQSLNYDFKNRPRRQDFELQFQENGAFYINTKGNIMDSRNRLTGKIGLYTMPKYSALELDDEVDWLIGENIMKSIHR